MEDKKKNTSSADTKAVERSKFELFDLHGLTAQILEYLEIDKLPKKVIIVSNISNSIPGWGVDYSLEKLKESVLHQDQFWIGGLRFFQKMIFVSPREARELPEEDRAIWELLENEEEKDFLIVLLSGYPTEKGRIGTVDSTAISKHLRLPSENFIEIIPRLSTGPGLEAGTRDKYIWGIAQDYAGRVLDCSQFNPHDINTAFQRKDLLEKSIQAHAKIASRESDIPILSDYLWNALRDLAIYYSYHNRDVKKCKKYRDGANNLRSYIVDILLKNTEISGQERERLRIFIDNRKARVRNSEVEWGVGR